MRINATAAAIAMPTMMTAPITKIAPAAMRTMA
jgi:hypothetical protein